MPLETRVLEMMGTVITLSIEHSEAQLLLEHAQKMLEDFQQRFSANQEDSELMKVNAQAGIKPVKVPSDLFNLIKKGRDMGISSHSKLNIAIGPLIKLWHIGFNDARVPTVQEIEEKLALVHLEDIELNEADQTVFLRQKGMEIDLGALAKGYFADQLKNYFQTKGVQSGIIDLGGNVLTIGESTKNPEGVWQIGIQNPMEERGNLVAVIKSKDQSVVTSGIYERVLKSGEKKYHHIFDSVTGYPVDNDIASLTIVSDQSLDGEFWTTILFHESPGKALNWLNQMPQIEGMVISRTNELYVSDKLKPHVVLLE
ncbi:FAD:protein FMN transferase [Enterococcus sp. AZ072]|uniref:FAD:protein FMN transferase n=1 Tax=unclassified Enterococcus TaxID=2608891 RepID=UPI003D268D22